MTDAHQVLISPVVTEKTTGFDGKFVFKVAPNSSAAEIKRAAKTFYGVDVKKVNIVNLPKKTRLVGRGRELTRRRAFKKAILTLEPGSKLDFNAFK